MSRNIYNDRAIWGTRKKELQIVRKSVSVRDTVHLLEYAPRVDYIYDQATYTIQLFWGWSEGRHDALDMEQ